MQEWQEVVERYLIPNTARKPGPDRQLIVQLLENGQTREYIIERAEKYLLETCSSWELCGRELNLLADPFQNTKGVRQEFLFGRSDLKKALKNKIEKLGFPKGGQDLYGLEYCLSIVGIKMRETTSSIQIEVEYKGWGLFKKRKEIKKTVPSSRMRAMEEIMRDLG